MTKISTGAPFLDQFLAGGYDYDIITTIYGPSGSGKTNLCLITAVNVAQKGKKVIFIDTEGGIAVERIRQITPNYEDVLSRLLFFNPVNFAEQNDIFDELKGRVDGNVGLIVVDSISMLYRLELGRSEEVYDVNATLGKQIACLVEIARKRKIPVLITNQVYSDFKNKDQVKMVGGDLLKYGSKCLLEIKHLHTGRCVVLRKHRSLPESKECLFKIVQQGVEEG
jgi:DNA repair protein RadB